MAFTQTDLDNIDRAISSGELTVSYNGRTVTHRSIVELKTARDLVLKGIPQAPASMPPSLGGRSYGIASFNHD